MSRRILLLQTEAEQERTKALYREIFPEDSDAFVDYYYRKRPKRILAMEEEGEIVGMLHINPFSMSFFKKELTASYLYAIGTKKEKRKQGIMGELLRRAFSLLEEEGEPFCFLIPVSESIYSPYGFRTIGKLSLEEKPLEEIERSVLYALPTKELLERRVEEAALSDEEDELPEDPVVMLKILNPEAFRKLSGYTDDTEDALLQRMAKERIYIIDVD